MFVLERISTYVDPWPRILQLLGVFQNSVFNVPCNCWERTLSIALIMLKYLSQWFSRKVTITMTEVVLIQSFLTVCFKQKMKIKMKARNTIACSYHPKVKSAQSDGILFFSCLCHVWVKHGAIIIRTYYISRAKVKVSPIHLTGQT